MYFVLVMPHLECGFPFGAQNFIRHEFRNDQKKVTRITLYKEQKEAEKKGF